MSSTRKKCSPPSLRDQSQAKSAVRALPRWSSPVGLGANRPRGFIVLSIIARFAPSATGAGRRGELEAGLVDLLVQDVRQQPGALPLLQHALLELWHKREGRRLTVKAYQDIGKLEGSLQQRADDTFKAFSTEEQELCRRTFLRLTQPGEGTEDTKRRVPMQELLSLSGSPAAEEGAIAAGELQRGRSRPVRDPDCR